ncbi:hypothetical protein AHF37_04325 [Paragonimus kellicotti]|nr:hypothetical protein AHF37_04325 [Paragonimus kellicotti]
MPDSLSNKNDKQVEKDLLSQDLLALGLDDDEKLNTVPIIAPAASLPQALPASAASTQSPYRTAKSDTSRYGELADIFANVSFTGPVTVVPTTRTSGSHNPVFSSGGPFSVLSPQSPSNGQPVAKNEQTIVNTSKTKVFDDLDALGRSMLGLPAQKPSARDSSDQKASTLTDISTRHVDTVLLNNSVRSASQVTSSLEHQVELTNLEPVPIRNPTSSDS